ncbi:Protein of unknown function [Gryllus bimaculatus]|nr:Protein of unknown function [Gryllus bimaculatus]
MFGPQGNAGWPRRQSWGAIALPALLRVAHALSGSACVFSAARREIHAMPGAEHSARTGTAVVTCMCVWRGSDDDYVMVVVFCGGGTVGGRCLLAVGGSGMVVALAATVDEEAAVGAAGHGRVGRARAWAWAGAFYKWRSRPALLAAAEGQLTPAAGAAAWAVAASGYARLFAPNG